MPELRDVATTNVLQSATCGGGGGIKGPLHERLALTPEPKNLGVCVVSAIGVSFFKGGKPVALQARGHAAMADLIDSCVKHGTSFDDAYWVRLSCGTEVALSGYWTRHFFGDAPTVDAGDKVNVFGTLNPKTGKAVFIYKR